MANALTLAQMRDEIRRKLQVAPPVDTGTGNPGDAPTAQPDPNNTLVNSAVNEGIDAINRVVRVNKLTDLQAAVTAPAATKRGTFYVDVSGVVSSALVANEIEDVWFQDASGNVVRLEPFDYLARKKDYQAYQQYAPGAPRQFLVSGGQIGLLPPPAGNGTLYFTTAGGIPPLVNDTDTIQYLPAEYQVAAQYWAVALLSARAAQDIEAETRMASYQALAAQATAQIYAWKNGYTDDAIQSVRDTLMMLPMREALRRMQTQLTLGGGGNEGLSPSAERGA